MQKKAFLLALIIVLSSSPLIAQVVGDYSGKLTLPGQELELFISIKKADPDGFSASLDVPMQGAKGIPVTVKENSDTLLLLDIPAIAASYKARPEGKGIKGTFSQMGVSLPLELKQIKEVPTAKRPQNPVAPYPYDTKKVTFRGKDKDVTLSGTIAYPVGYTKGMKPKAIVMVTGSGPQDRNEEVFEHKPFLVISDYLARHGIASLRYDDRGVGKSEGPTKGMTTSDVARDAEAAVKVLRSSGEFSSVGILGHSEGGMVAFMLGSKDKVDFVVTLAATGVRGDSVLLDQIRSRIAMTGGQIDDTDSEKYLSEFRAMHDPWMDFFLSYDPATDISKTNVPVMALNGEKDQQVVFPKNLDMIRALLPKNTRNITKSYPQLNHLFQTSDTGSPTEYYSLEETISPEVLEDIASWINAL